MPSNHLGWLSNNGSQKGNVLGEHSRPRLLFSHGGQITGYLNTVYMFPETKSAIVVLTSAQGAGDCSDLVAQAIIQELFELQPRLDFRSMAKQTATENLNKFENMKSLYEEHRESNAPSPPREDIIGVYYNDAVRMTIDVFEEKGGLYMQLNDRKS